MNIPDKNNPDGQGSYGRAPSRFVKRPKEKVEDRPNDATAAPMGHSCKDQVVIDEEQRRQAQSPSSEKKTTPLNQSGRRLNQKPETRHPEDEKEPGELRKE